MSEFVAAEHHDKVCEIRLARPDKRNAITDAMYAALADALETADADPDVAVAILHGEGRTFSAGNDLKDFIAVARRQWRLRSPAPRGSKFAAKVI